MSPVRPTKAVDASNASSGFVFPFGGQSRMLSAPRRFIALSWRTAVMAKSAILSLANSRSWMNDPGPT